jgi:hypothetical protein
MSQAHVSGDTRNRFVAGRDGRTRVDEQYRINSTQCRSHRRSIRKVARYHLDAIAKACPRPLGITSQDSRPIAASEKALDHS